MSLINNIPFDINRTAVEKNATVKRKGTVPVQHSEAIHPTEKHNRINERRSGRRRSRRNKKGKYVKLNKRLLGERRQLTTRTRTNTDILSDKAHGSGSIIDLKV